MQVGWISHQGLQRRSNNDAAAVGRKGGYLLAMLVDAAEQGNGQALARHWARTVIGTALAAELPPDTASLIRLMRAEQQQLRRHYLHAIASYCCALIDLQHRQLHLLQVGDCLAGIQRHDGNIDWLTRPHNLKEQLIWQDYTLDTPNNRHLLTRSLNARRFYSPECQTVTLPPDVGLILCSDGYWYEHLQQGVGLEEVEDDASMLRLGLAEPGLWQQTDSDNLFTILI
ncbi:MAG: PP2C family protein-serine/threonine phosphatase [Pseudomonas sp.]